MGETTDISWTKHTFNAVWGCTKVSEGCRNCYAETLAKRWGFDVWGPDKERRIFGDKHWAEPLKWNTEAEGSKSKVFCESMGDVFEDHPTSIAQLPRLWALIKATPNLDWQLLTKRPERIAQSLPADWGSGYQNVWLGTSVEDQAAADERIPHLQQTVAAVRFLSCEPLLGPITFRPKARDEEDMVRMTLAGQGEEPLMLAKIHWVIVGGESGPNWRPMDLDWARGIRDQCRAAGVAFFFKQAAGRRPQHETTLDGETLHEYPRGHEGGAGQ